MAATTGKGLTDLRMNEERYIAIMTKFIGEVEHLQNNPIQGLVPQEDRICQHVIDTLEPFMQANGGPLIVEHVPYVEGRGNMILTYPGTTNKTVAFVGSHMDVVPADPESWDFDPFTLRVEDGKLFGRGTTDSLGHVGMVTELFCLLGENRPVLEHSIVAVFIAAEEGGSQGIGVDELVKRGRLDHLKDGPIIWVDSADGQPCVGTASSITWHLRANGKLFHSGLPHRGINAIELVQEATKWMQERFYTEFAAHPKEARYAFDVPSTMKPTQMECSRGSLNQIPPWAQCSGDIRLTPFYEVSEVMDALKCWVAELNADLSVLPTRGPCSKFTLPDGDILTGTLELTLDEHFMEGIACSLDSRGHRALYNATCLIKGKDNTRTYSIGGSLPLVREMQRNGFDVQITGFGLSSTYHANNEYSLLSDMADGVRILAELTNQLETGAVDADVPPTPPAAE